VRLLEEIRAAGYPAGYSQLQALVQRVRPISVRRSAAAARALQMSCCRPSRNSSPSV
jgi:hypothetical protein